MIIGLFYLTLVLIDAYIYDSVTRNSLMMIGIESTLYIIGIVSMLSNK